MSTAGSTTPDTSTTTTDTTVTTTTTDPNAAKAAAGVFGLFAGIGIFSLIFFLIFHIGAGYLSYQKYGSMLWAVLDFLFPYFYYPYYAFFLAKDMPPQTMFGGRKGLSKSLLKRR
jgi:hypothetical protein